MGVHGDTSVINSRWSASGSRHEFAPCLLQPTTYFVDRTGSTHNEAKVLFGNVGPPHMAQSGHIKGGSPLD